MKVNRREFIGRSSKALLGGLAALIGLEGCRYRILGGAVLDDQTYNEVLAQERRARKEYERTHPKSETDYNVVYPNRRAPPKLSKDEQLIQDISTVVQAEYSAIFDRTDSATLKYGHIKKEFRDKYGNLVKLFSGITKAPNPFAVNELRRRGILFLKLKNGTFRCHEYFCGPIVEKGEREVEAWGVKKRVRYVIYNQKLGYLAERKDMARPEFLVTPSGLVVADREGVMKDWARLFNTMRYEKYKWLEEPADRAYYRHYREVIDGDKSHFDIQKESVLFYHEPFHSDSKDPVEKEIKAYLTSLANRPSYYEIGNMLEFERENHTTPQRSAADWIFREFNKRGVPREQIPDETKEAISSMAAQIYLSQFGSVSERSFTPRPPIKRKS